MDKEQPNSAPAQQTAQPTHGKSKLLMAAIVSLVAVCLVGGSAFAYYKLTFAAKSVSPIELIKKSLQASKDIRSFSFAATSTGQLENQDDNGFPASSTFVMATNGSTDFHSLANVLLSANSKISASANTATTTGSLAIDLSAIYANKKAYLNLKNFDVSYSSQDPKTIGTQMVVGMAKGLVSSLENKWLEIDTNKTLKASSTQNYFSKEDTAAIKNYMSGMSYLTAISNVGQETISNIPVYHLKLTIQNGKELTDLIRKISLEKQPVAPKDMAKFEKQMADTSKIVTQKVDLDVWVGKNDYLVYKVISSPITISDTETGKKLTDSLEATFNGYNQPVSITAPAGAVSLKDMMQNMLGGMFGKTKTY